MARESRREAQVAEEGDFHAKYRLNSRLGAGAYGTVYLATRRGIDTEVAVKAVALRTTEPLNKKAKRARLYRIVSEVTAWSTVEEHPNIVHLHEWYLDFRFAYFVMDRCCGLVQALKKEPTLNEGTYKKYFNDMASALEHIHSLCVLHRDVKHSNFVVGGTSGFTVKLCDFGLAAVVSKGHHLPGGVGSAPYAAPETVAWYGRRHGCASDVWSFGVIVYVAFFGIFPYLPKDPSATPVEDLIREGTVVPKFRPPRKLQQNPVSTVAVSFVRALLHRDPKKRPSARACLEMDYLCNPSPGMKELAPEGPEGKSLFPMLDYAIPSDAPSASMRSEDRHREFGLSALQARAQARMAARAADNGLTSGPGGPSENKVRILRRL